MAQSRKLGLVGDLPNQLRPQTLELDQHPYATPGNER